MNKYLDRDPLAPLIIGINKDIAVYFSNVAYFVSMFSLNKQLMLYI
jgi:hypothetical protein